VDASFFPSCGAFNPALTIAANALRVGDHFINTQLMKREMATDTEPVMIQ
jgi:choline dehydrogenase-like flavoprotein